MNAMGRAFITAAALLWTAEAAAAQVQIVAIGTYATLKEAQDAAKVASARLSYPIAHETLLTPLDVPMYGGKVVAVHKAQGYFVVTSFMGDKDEAQGALDHSRMFFRKSVTQQLEVPRIDGSYLAHIPSSVVIAGVRSDYAEAVRLAQHLSAHSGIPYSNRGMVFTKDRGLIWPDGHQDKVLAGAYYARRINACSKDMPECITVERSEFYMGFEPGYYVVVGGIFKTSQKSYERAEKLREFSPEAYAKNTAVFLGCTLGRPQQDLRLVDDDGEEWLTQAQ